MTAEQRQDVVKPGDTETGKRNKRTVYASAMLEKREPEQMILGHQKVIGSRK